MRFHNYETQATTVRRSLPSGLRSSVTEEWLDDMLIRLKKKYPPDDPTYGLMQSHRRWDKQWAADGRPYYLVYPSLIPMLTRLNLDQVDCSSIRLPHGLTSLLVRFPVGHELMGTAKTIWMAERVFETPEIQDADFTACRSLVIGIDNGDVRDGHTVFHVHEFPLTVGLTANDLTTSLGTIGDTARQMDSCADEHAPPVGYPKADTELALNGDHKLGHHFLRLACTLCLIGDDPSILEPEVLAKDQHRVDEANVQQLVEKAQRRGNFGWALGRAIETIPHYRRPHPALVWTGVGRTTPKVIMRKGSVVHREVVAAVPTGYGREHDNCEAGTA